MSIQDESFPYDDDLELSRNSGKNFVFPNRNLRRAATTATSSLAREDPIDNQHNVSGKSSITASSSPLQNQDDSNEFCAASETSGKTNASEPNDLQGKREYLNKTLNFLNLENMFQKPKIKNPNSKDKIQINPFPIRIYIPNIPKDVINMLKVKSANI